MLVGTIYSFLTLVMTIALLSGIANTVHFRSKHPNGMINRGRLLCLAGLPFIIPSLAFAAMINLMPALVLNFVRGFWLLENAQRFGILMVVVAVPVYLIDRINIRRRWAAMRAQADASTSDEEVWPPPPSTARVHENGATQG